MSEGDQLAEVVADEIEAGIEEGMEDAVSDMYYLGVTPHRAFRGYGIWAMVNMTIFPLLFNLLMRNHTVFGSVGYKFAAYMHFYLFLPVSLMWIVADSYKTKVSLSVFNFFSQVSMSGPFLLYPIACYYMFRWGTQMWYGWLGAGLFTAYTLLSIFGCVALLPGIDTMYWDWLYEDASAVGNTSNPLDDNPLPEDFNDWGYLGLPTLDIGI